MSEIMKKTTTLLLLMICFQWANAQCYIGTFKSDAPTCQSGDYTGPYSYDQITLNANNTGVYYSPPCLRPTQSVSASTINFTYTVNRNVIFIDVTTVKQDTTTIAAGNRKQYLVNRRFFDDTQDAIIFKCGTNITGINTITVRSSIAELRGKTWTK